MVRNCKDCGKILEKEKRQRFCKECSARRKKEANSRWQGRNIEEVRRKGREYSHRMYRLNPEKFKERSKRQVRNYQQRMGSEKYRLWLKDYRKIYWERRRNETIQKLGGKCQECGYNECLAALEFHHEDPKNNAKEPRNDWMKKDFDLTQIKLLCANCHTKLHHT